MQRSSQTHRPLLSSAVRQTQAPHFRQSGACPCPQQLGNGHRAVQAAAYQFKQGPDVPERAIAALPYLLPLLDALPYGEFLLLQCICKCTSSRTHQSTCWQPIPCLVWYPCMCCSPDLLTCICGVACSHFRPTTAAGVYACRLVSLQRCPGSSHVAYAGSACQGMATRGSFILLRHIYNSSMQARTCFH
jgi:hypothetical protein